MIETELATLLSNITLDENQSDMTTTGNASANHTNYQLLRLYLDSIPHYDGNPHTLGIFLDSCEHLIVTFARDVNPDLNNFLIRAIYGKLVGRALTLIGSRLELATWQEVKQALTLSFGDQRNIDCLVQDLISLRPDKNETPYNFGMRCQDARSLVTSKLNSDTSMSVDEKSIRIKNYDNLALKTFIRGLPIQIQTNVRLRNPNTLENAMSFVIEEENFLYSTQKANALNTQTNFRPINRITPTNYNNPFRREFNATKTYHQPTNFNNTNQHTFTPNYRPNNQNYQPQRNPNPFYNSMDRQNTRPNFFATRQPQFTPRPFQNQSPQFTPRPFQNQSPQFTPRPFQQQSPQYSQNFNQRFGNPNQTKQFKPEPMDTSSGRSHTKSQYTNKLYTQRVNDNHDNLCDPQNYQTTEDYNNYNDDNFSYQNYDNQFSNEFTNYEDQYPIEDTCDYNYDQPDSDVNFQQDTASTNPT